MQWRAETPRESPTVRGYSSESADCLWEEPKPPRTWLSPAYFSLPKDRVTSPERFSTSTVATPSPASPTTATARNGRVPVRRKTNKAVQQCLFSNDNRHRRNKKDTYPSVSFRPKGEIFLKPFTFVWN